MKFWCKGRSPKPRSRLAGGLLGGALILAGEGIDPTTALGNPAPKNPTLAIGIVQRFGTEGGDRLELAALPGDRLTVSFTDGQGRSRNLAVQTLAVTVGSVPLPTAQLDERLVLGTYRSFETAEAAAQTWRGRGIAVEIAQPSDQWQVWADRSAYGTPLLRRMLYDSLEPLRQAPDHGIVLTSRSQTQRPLARWTVGNETFQGDRLAVSAGQGVVRVGGDRFAGRLRLQPNAYGTYSLVNDVPLETYLRGVVPYEIGPGAPNAALEAQTIVARTYTLRNLRRFAIDDYELCADTHCQVYRGLGAATARTDGAIAATRGRVMVYGDELIDALYFSTSGGVTAAFESVWDGPNRPYLRPVIDAAGPLWDLAARPLNNEQNLRQFLSLTQGFNEVGWRDFRWRREGTLESLADTLKRYLARRNHPLANFQRLERLTVRDRAIGGRIQTLIATTDRGEVAIEKDAVRAALMPPRSSLFYLDPIERTNPDGSRTLTGYRFVGGGWGHGVGLSQAGSHRLANLGWNADRILRFYYPGAAPVPLTDALVYWRDPTTPPTTTP
ncbi:MAG: SpoIID/LytB domain-containing protein [Cyanophyceae cyanobacterium]